MVLWNCKVLKSVREMQDRESWLTVLNWFCAHSSGKICLKYPNQKILITSKGRSECKLSRNEKSTAWELYRRVCVSYSTSHEYAPMVQVPSYWTKIGIFRAECAVLALSSNWDATVEDVTASTRSPRKLKKQCTSTVTNFLLVLPGALRGEKKN